MKISITKILFGAIIAFSFILNTFAQPAFYQHPAAFCPPQPAGSRYCNSPCCHFMCPDAMGRPCTGTYVIGPDCKQGFFESEHEDGLRGKVNFVSLASGNTHFKCGNEGTCKDLRVHCGDTIGRQPGEYGTCTLQCDTKACVDIKASCVGKVDCKFIGGENQGSGQAFKSGEIFCYLSDNKRKCTMECGRGMTSHTSCDGVRFGCHGTNGNCFCIGPECQTFGNIVSAGRLDRTQGLVGGWQQNIANPNQNQNQWGSNQWGQNQNQNQWGTQNQNQNQQQQFP